MAQPLLPSLPPWRSKAGSLSQSSVSRVGLSPGATHSAWEESVCCRQRLLRDQPCVRGRRRRGLVRASFHTLWHSHPTRNVALGQDPSGQERMTRQKQHPDPTAKLEPLLWGWMPNGRAGEFTTKPPTSLHLPLPPSPLLDTLFWARVFRFPE